MGTGGGQESSTPSSHFTSLRAYAALTALSIIWGLAFVAIRWAETLLAPVSMALLRWLLASCGLLVLWPFIGKARTRYETRDTARLLVVSFANVVSYHLTLYYSEKTISAGLAGLLVSIGPVLIVVLSWALLKEKHGKEIVFALLLTFTGAAILAIGSIGSGGSVVGILEAIGTAVSYAVFAVLSKPLVSKYGAIPIAIWSGLVGTAMLLPLISPEFFAQVLHLTALGWLAMLYLSLLSTVVGYMLFYSLIGKGSVSRLSIQLYFIPVVSVVGGALILGEGISVYTIAGGAAMLFAIALATMKRPLGFSSKRSG